MGDDIASLNIRIKSLEAEVADRRLKGLSGTARGTERATKGLTGTFIRFAGPVAVATAAIAGLKKAASVQREFDILNAQLITATGSAENASEAFQAIQDFASQTPFDLQQATKGFTQLVNLGLTPSEEAMVSYGDTASAMGKDLGQLIEAVADASTGEFERLKEFGIKASSQGDQVAFTFRGVTTTVKKNADEIEDYLIKLGQNNFAGAMANRMDTLDGAMSNLGDEWDKLWLNISQKGLGDAMEEGVRGGIGALEDLNRILSSGELEAYLDVIAEKFSGFTGAVADGFGFMSDLWGEVPSEWKGYASKAIDFILDAFRNLPENVFSLIQLVGVEIASLVDYAKAFGGAYIDILVLTFNSALDKAKLYGRAIGDALNPFNDDNFDLDKELAKVDSSYSKTASKIVANAKKEVSATTELRKQAILDVLKEREAVNDAVDAKISKIEQLKKAYLSEQEARRNSEEDRLAKFKVKPEEVVETGGGDVGTPATAEFDRLRESLLMEEEAIAESYERRRKIILDNTKEGSDEQLILMKRLTQQREDEIAEIERATLEARLAAGESAFADMADITESFGRKQSGLYRVMFAASKAFAIADATVKIFQGVAAAAATPWPLNIAAIASTISATAGLISNIKSISMNFAGAYDSGGSIPAGATGLVGEIGPELVKGPATVTGRVKTAQMLAQAQNGAGNTVVNVYNNATGANATVSERQEGDTTYVDVLIDSVKKGISRDIREGGNHMSSALEQSYGLRRGAA